MSGGTIAFIETRTVKKAAREGITILKFGRRKTDCFTKNEREPTAWELLPEEEDDFQIFTGTVP